MKNDFKYIIKKVIIGLLIIFVLSLINSCQVHAETFDINSNTTIGGYNLPNYWSIYTAGRNLVVKYNDYQLYSQMPETGYASFGYFNVCANGSFTVNNSSADCNDGCFNNEFQVVNLGGTCSITADNQTITGFPYYIFYSVKEWGFINADTLPIVYDTLTFTSTAGYNVLLEFRNNFLSNDDLYVNFASNGRLQELQEQTNSLIQNQTNSIINNNNSNTNSIINNQDSNTQDIIDNQNSNTEQQIESQKVCQSEIVDSSSIEIPGKYLYASGSYGTDLQGTGITKYFNIFEDSILKVKDTTNDTNIYLCFYNQNKNLISCIEERTLLLDQVINIPNGSSYVRFSINGMTTSPYFDKPKFEILNCKNGNQALNDNINDDNVSGAESQVNDLLNNSSFQDNSGIQSIITAPLNFIQSLSNTCSPISITIPYINSNLSIPCIKQELNNHIPTIVPVLSTAINGFVIYRILIDIVAIVKSAREPDEDRIEVLDL